jgi:4-alpha-glucanotransferase
MHELLAILAIESTRAKAIIIGEDLGTVEDSLRDELRARQVLSTRLVWFEDRPPSEFPAQALAAVTSHDLPTITGVWTGSDLADQRAAGIEADGGARSWFRSRLDRRSDLQGTIVATYAALGRSPSMLVAVTMEDALAVAERPNLPGTVDERPNWQLALPRSLEEIETDPLVLEVAGAVDRARGE